MRVNRFALRMLLPTTRYRIIIILVWSLDELATMIEAQPALIRKTKQRFPGAVVTGVRDSNYDWSKGDDIPF